MLFSFVCCLSFVVVTWKTSCRTSTSSHHSNYSTKAPPIKSFPACGFCTSQGNLKSPCHLLNTLKCGPWSRLHDRGGWPATFNLTYLGTPPPCKQAPSVWSRLLNIGQVVVVVVVVLFFSFLSSGSIKTQKPSWPNKLGLSRTYFVAKKRIFFIEGPTREMSSPLSRLAN